MIAHRLSTIRHADRILVLEGGEIVEAGSHGELMSLSGLTSDMGRIAAIEEGYVVGSREGEGLEEWDESISDFFKELPEPSLSTPVSQEVE